MNHSPKTKLRQAGFVFDKLTGTWKHPKADPLDGLESFVENVAKIRKGGRFFYEVEDGKEKK